MTEQRQHQRVDIEMVLFDRSAGTFVPVATRNVSAGGVFLVISPQPPLDTELRLAVTLPGEGDHSRVRQLIGVRGLVTRIADDGVGVAFLEPSDELKAALATAGVDG